MYLQAFGLERYPFGMTPDPGFLYLTPQHREALTGLAYAVLDRKGFVVLTGDAGTGKTTLLTRVLQYLPAGRIQSSVIVNPTLTPAEFLEMTLLDFGIADFPPSKAQRLLKLENLLMEGDRAGKISTLVVDEAHKLSHELLEEIRLLGNFENAGHKLLQILLIGQGELGDLLNREDLRQLKQRVAVRLRIGALSDAEVEQYVQHRWRKAGAKQPAPFTSEALSEVAAYSHGIPRLVNVVCDNALTLAFARGLGAVGAGHVIEAACELDLINGIPVRERAPEGLKAAAAQNGSATSHEALAEESAISRTEPAPEPELQLAGFPLKTLERYETPPGKTSLWSRWLRKLGLT